MEHTSEGFLVEGGQCRVAAEYFSVCLRMPIVSIMKRCCFFKYKSISLRRRRRQRSCEATVVLGRLAG